MHASARVAGFVLAILASGLVSCTRYQAKPLPQNAGEAPSLSALVARLPESRARLIQLQDGLSLNEAAALGLSVNPDLRAQRAALAVNQAQAFADGLLPDPQLSYSLDRPSDTASSLVNGSSLGLSLDLAPLLTLASHKASRRARIRQARLQMMWAEWQTIQHMQELVVAYSVTQQRQNLLAGAVVDYRQAYRVSQRAFKAGDIASDSHAQSLTSLNGIEQQLNRARLDHAQAVADLRRALDLQSDAAIYLTGLPKLSRLDTDKVQRHLDRIALMRPDLLALKAGYQAQQARVRAAVLAQFPAINLGFNRAKDTSNVHTQGFAVSISLPLFNRNRGAIAVERATRNQLYADYRARLGKTQRDARQILTQAQLLRRQATRNRRQASTLSARHQASQVALAHGDITLTQFLARESDWLNARLVVLTTRKRQWRARLALSTLLMLPVTPSLPVKLSEEFSL